MIITIGREYGSNGHRIGELVAEKLGVKVYDKENLAEEARKTDYYEDLQAFYEETPVNSLLYVIATRSYNGGRQGEVPFAFIRKIAEQEPCVIIGRCGNYILRNHPDAVNVFIHQPMKERVERIMKDQGISQSKAEMVVEREDKAREGFHTYYTDEKWNLADGYDLTINSSAMSAEDAADMIIAFARKKVPAE